jgi:hypothetical protein
VVLCVVAWFPGSLHPEILSLITRSNEDGCDCDCEEWMMTVRTAL